MNAFEVDEKGSNYVFIVKGLGVLDKFVGNVYLGNLSKNNWGYPSPKLENYGHTNKTTLNKVR